jgi:hypothetical protein
VDKSEWDLKIDENGTLIIPTFNCFGRELFKTNSVLTKLQYLSCYYICGLYENRVAFSKKVHKFKNVIKDILGIKKIIFEDYVDYWKGRDSGDITGEEESYYEYPFVDHESFDIFKEITENESTLKNFLLNKHTWLYGGDDSGRGVTKFYLDTELPPTLIGCFSANFGGDIGRVDVEITENLEDLNKELSFFTSYFSKNDDGKWDVTAGFVSFLWCPTLNVKNRKLYIDDIQLNFELYKYDVFSI